MQTLCKHLERTNMCEDLCRTANYRVGQLLPAQLAVLFRPEKET